MSDAPGRLDRVVRRVLDESASSLGSEYLLSLARNLAEELDLDQVFVGRLSEDGRSVHALAVWANAARGEPFSYELDGTPCQEVMDSRACAHADRVHERFPRDRMLAEGGYRGYVGVPLRAPEGKTLGILVGLRRRPLEDPAFATSVLLVFAARAAAELDRAEKDAALQSALAALERRREADAYLLRLAGRLLTVQGPELVEVMPQVFAELGAALDVDAVCGYFFDDDGALQPACHWHREPLRLLEPNAAALGAAVQREWWRRTCGDGRPLRIEDLERQAEQAGPLAGWMRARGARSLACFPLLGPGGLFGVLELSSARPRRWEEEESATLQHAAQLASASMQRVEAERCTQRLHEQMARIERLESVGQLASGIAHDLNNLLVVLLCNGELLLSADPPLPGRAAGLVGEMLQASKRAASLTRQLLVFASKQPSAPIPLDLNERIDGLLALLRRTIPEHVRIDFIPGHDLGTVSCDPAQLDQVILNLAVNAADAMPDGGRLTIETENVLINGDYTRLHPWARPGRFVLLSVTDTGCGMDPETQQHVFEPFFTTKGPGKGTGLGLATVYGIVRRHQGLVHLYSEPGQGTTFKVYLPIVERSARSVGRKVARGGTGRGERLLLAEDDEGVRRVTTRLLEEAGYRVVPACSGEEALALAVASRAEPFALAILDAIMPEGGGRELYEELRARLGDDFPIVFASGYGGDALRPVSEVVARDPRCAFVPKPFDGDQLTQTIRALLDADR